jgi:hypothetical protein
MRKAILIIIQVILLVLFLRSDFAQHFFGGVAVVVVDWYEQVVEVPERRKIMTLRDKFMRNNMALASHQVDYVIEVTDTQESINTFYKLYCIKQDKNPYLYGANLKKFCADIASSDLLVVNE